ALVDTAHYVTQLHTDPRLDLTYLFDGIDTVIDDEDAPDLDKGAAEKRIAEADSIIVNGRSGNLEVALRAAGSINPFAKILANGKDLSEPHSIKPVRIMGNHDLNRVIGGTCLVNNLFNDNQTNQPAPDAGVIRAMQAEIPGVTDIQRLFSLLQELREQLGKNLLRLRCTTHIRNGDYPIGFQMVGSSWTPPFYETDQGDAKTRLRIVARGLDAEAVFDQLRSCVWGDDDVMSRRIPLF
ncbi:MAG: hypothetical protein HN377_12715, partial [Alphaproteobacteria bacterium]|nr:hypothetical protein [Alphaproteobacteria bacterium]